MIAVLWLVLAVLLVLALALNIVGDCLPNSEDKEDKELKRS